MRSKAPIATLQLKARLTEHPPSPLTTGPLSSAMGVIYGLLFSGVLWIIGGMIAFFYW